MIAFLKGEVLTQDSEVLILDVQGVGYELNCSQNTLDDMLSCKGAVGVQVHTYVREDALTLFGFSKKQEKQLFLSLVKVNGIGPKMAIKILSGAPLERIIGMIEEEDVKGLTGLPKVGKKTAEQMILTLKGKLVMSDEDGKGKVLIGPRQEIVSALVNLGFRLNEVEKAVAQLDTKIDVQSGVREGLRILSANF